MSQVSDYNIANASGASVRSDLNAVFDAIKTLNSGGSDPSNTSAFMPYVDTADNNNLKLRSDNAIITLGANDEVTLRHEHNNGVKLELTSGVEDAYDPQFILETNSSNNQYGPMISFQNTGTNTNGHEAGRLWFKANTSTGALVGYSRIWSEIVDNTNGARAGKLVFNIPSANTYISPLEIYGNGSNTNTVTKVINTFNAQDTFQIGGTTVSSTAAELNILDGVTSTTAELNILDGVTSTAAELNILDGVTSTTAELNILDGVTATAAEINLLDGATDTTWTATLNGSTGNPGSKVTATGQYVQMGKMVMASVHFNSVDTTSYAGDITISGLPVTSKDTATAMFLGNVYNNGMISGATDSVQALVADNGTTISFLENANASALQWGTVGAGKSMRVQVFYIAA